MAFTPLDLAIVLVGAREQARAIEMQQAEANRVAQQQLDYTRRQGEALDMQRRAMMERQDMFRRQRAEDMALRERQRQLQAEAEQRFGPDSLTDELNAEQARLADIIAPPSSVGDINASAAAITSGSSNGLSGTMFEDTLSEQTAKAGDAYTREAGALADLTAFGTVGKQQNIDMDLFGTNMDALGGLRRGLESAYDQWSTVQGSREDALGAAADIWANAPIYSDNTAAQNRGTLGTLMAMYGLNKAGQYFGDPERGQTRVDLSQERPYSFYPDMMGP